MSEWFFRGVCFFTDIIEALVDIYDTWKEKDEKVRNKIIGTIITLFFLGISVWIWIM